MATYINNIEELEQAMFPVMESLVDELTKRVYQTLNYFLNDYYTAWTPEYYRRTKASLYSAIRTKAKIKGGKCEAYVYIDYHSMNDYVKVTGFQVAEWANTGTHGGVSVHHKPHVWDDTIQNTIDNNSLLNEAIVYLRSKGFTVLQQ